MAFIHSGIGMYINSQNVSQGPMRVFPSTVRAERVCICMPSKITTQNAIRSVQGICLTRTSHYSVSGTSVAAAQVYSVGWVLVAPIVVGIQHYRRFRDHRKEVLVEEVVVGSCGLDFEIGYGCVKRLLRHWAHCCFGDRQRRWRLQRRISCSSFFACSCASSR